MISEKEIDINYILRLDRDIDRLRDKKTETLSNFTNADVGTVFMSKIHKKIVILTTSELRREHLEMEMRLKRISMIFGGR